MGVREWAWSQKSRHLRIEGLCGNGVENTSRKRVAFPPWAENKPFKAV